jgi:hypothetical protein
MRFVIEQRDSAIRMGATGATTLLFRENKFVMPASSSGQDTLRKEQNIRAILIDKLKPQQEDVIIIGSANIDRKTAELAAKHAALLTLVNHEKHN